MRRPLALMLAGLALVAAAACGTDASAAEIVRTAATKTIEANTARTALSIRMGGATTGSITSEGAYDFATRRGRSTVKVSGIGSFRGTSSFEAVTDGLVFYLRVPSELAARFGSGKSWVKYDLASAAKQFGVDVGGLGTASQGDPTAILEFLRGASDDVTKVGEETLRGAATTHYRATLDAKKALAKLDGEQRRRDEKAIGQLGDTTFPVDVWIDGAGRARKLTWSRDRSKTAATRTGNVSVTVELYDFGTTVDATPPPADQVVDLGAFLPGNT